MGPPICHWDSKCRSSCNFRICCCGVCIEVCQVFVEYWACEKTGGAWVCWSTSICSSSVGCCNLTYIQAHQKKGAKAYFWPWAIRKLRNQSGGKSPAKHSLKLPVIKSHAGHVVSEGLEWKKRHSWRHQNAPCLGERAWFDFAATCVQKQCPQCHSGSSHTDQRPCSPPPHPASPATNPQYDPTTAKPKTHHFRHQPNINLLSSFLVFSVFFHYFLQFFSIPVQCLSLFALKSSVSHRTKTSSPTTVSKSTIHPPPKKRRSPSPHPRISAHDHSWLVLLFQPIWKIWYRQIENHLPQLCSGWKFKKKCIYIYIYIYVCVWLKQPPPSYSYINI